ncbi:hypothetical protein MUNTM_05860 [Mycobacterium sp. MUNTM1]
MNTVFLQSGGHAVSARKKSGCRSRLLCDRNVNGWETFAVVIFTAGVGTAASRVESKRRYLHKQLVIDLETAGFERKRPAGRRFNSAGVLAECGTR